LKQIRKVLAGIKRADNLFNLISDGDVIAVGISGGKDSIVLFYALTLYQKFAKKDFKLVPIMLDLGFPGFDAKEYEEYFKTLGYTLNVVDSKQVYPILLTQKDLQHTPHLPCSICSRMKKAAVNTEAKKFNCNKVAFAHHVDDAIETLFMNMINGSRIATFSPKMHLENVNLTFIRPLVLLDEKTIRLCQKELDLPVLESKCPNDKETRREDIKNLLHDIRKQYKEANSSFETMLLNSESFDLWFDKREYPLDKNTKIIPVYSANQTKEYFDLLYDYYGFPLKENPAISSFNVQNAYILEINNKPAGTVYFHQINKNTFALYLLSKTKETPDEVFIEFLNYLENMYNARYHPLFLEAETNEEFTSLLQTNNYKQVDNKLTKQLK
jgi:tRNA(Ile)-lysidine synthase TilS/MesJ